jgi:hypothetical protein
MAGSKTIFIHFYTARWESLATDSAFIFLKHCNMHLEKLPRFSVMMYRRSEVKLLELLTLALWSDEFHVLATYSQRELPPTPTKQEAGWIESWYR